jgi:general secretion pathway protein D
LGGIQDNQETQSWTGIPGLSSIPILKYLFGSKDHTIQKDEIVFVVVPHVVRGADIRPQDLRAIDTGTGQSIDLRHVANGAAPGAPEARPTALDTAHPTFGTVPGQSADAAAPAALAQMRASMQPSFAQPPPMQAIPAPVAQPGAANVQNQPQAAPAAAGPASFALNIPAAPVAVGSDFQVPVVLAGGTDVSSIPLQFHFDQTKLSLVNVSQGSFLNRDGQAAAVIHRDDGAGNLTVVTSRPPGAAGLSGGGVVCVLTFQAKAAGESTLAITQGSTVNSSQQQSPAQGASANIVVR